MAEQPAVNRQVLGSNPSQGALHRLIQNAPLRSPYEFSW